MHTDERTGDQTIRRVDGNGQLVGIVCLVEEEDE
jgi:hypothetical protein